MAFAVTAMGLACNDVARLHLALLELAPLFAPVANLSAWGAASFVDGLPVFRKLTVQQQQPTLAECIEAPGTFDVGRVARPRVVMLQCAVERPAGADLLARVGPYLTSAREPWLVAVTGEAAIRPSDAAAWWLADLPGIRVRPAGEAEAFAHSCHARAAKAGQPLAEANTHVFVDALARCAELGVKQRGVVLTDGRHLVAATHNACVVRFALRGLSENLAVTIDPRFVDSAPARERLRRFHVAGLAVVEPGAVEHGSVGGVTYTAHTSGVVLLPSGP